MKPRLLDLFCCEGGAATGYHQAGFDVVGVDIVEQPLYPFTFWKDDAVSLLSDAFRQDRIANEFDAIHASPPCQSYSNMSNRHGSDEPELIAPVRELLDEIGLPYVIENVVGARSHMRNPVLLHGGHFGIGVYRPRLFETNWLLMAPGKAARPKDAAAVYGRREDRRRLLTRKDGTELRAASLEEAREAMEMPWADWNGVREAIPPAYTRFIGEQLLAHLEAQVAS